MRRSVRSARAERFIAQIGTSVSRLPTPESRHSPSHPELAGQAEYASARVEQAAIIRRVALLRRHKRELHPPPQRRGVARDEIEARQVMGVFEPRDH